MPQDPSGLSVSAPHSRSLLAHSLGFALGLAIFTLLFFSLFGHLIQLFGSFAMFVTGAPIYAATNRMRPLMWRGVVLSCLVPCAAAPLAMAAICFSDRCTWGAFEFLISLAIPWGLVPGFIVSALWAALFFFMIRPAKPG